ncbi:copper-containing nitrite reductase [Leptospira limi]|uniref:Copper-containing nitrite reductase n=1 Tax=Leptospira limi TaxID=2950023 RepID=A0ABT3LWZ3_9LEPT|nr:copper-containing nitrite reductase [Leptospira limi]MCW7462005.1 copper-containing nitrite reductase [Leptospira limi]
MNFIKSRQTIFYLFLLYLSTFLFQCGKETTVEAKLTYAPQVPPHIDRTYEAKVVVNIETVEVVGRLADGVEYTFWTFGGSVPGPMIRVREGDQVEFHLKNHPSSKMPHNIDLHAVTGQGGGAAASLTIPGHASKFSFKALNPGLFIYHCATSPVGMHIANGMYGLIFVQPKDDLPKVDKEYYVVQSEFYTKGKNGEPGLQSFSMEKAITEIPDYVVFNGSVGSLVEDRAITAKVGEKVRLFVGNGGPNLVSSFHVIGEIFDHVYTEGGILPNQNNVQTTLIPAGGSAIVDFTVDVPGTLILVDHSIFRTFNKGSLGMLKVEGEPNPNVYSGKQEDTVYLPEGPAIQRMVTEVKPKVSAKTKEEILANGERVYKSVCSACHMKEGQGVAGVFPPLAKSDFLNADKQRAIQVLKKGLSGQITVNGQKYNNVMPHLELSNEEIASVLSYVYHNWNNKGYMVTEQEVK